MKNKKTVCVFVGARANYSSIKPILFELKKNNKLNFKLMVGGSAVLEKYGNLEKVIKKDGFKIDIKFFNQLDGENNLTMLKSTSKGIDEISTHLNLMRPDLGLVVGDRYETLSFTISCAFLNIPIAHTMGGETSGSIDERIRHVNTKFSDYHFPATKLSEKRIIQLGENKKRIFNVGCPRIDILNSSLKKKINIKKIFDKGVGKKFDISKKFLMLSQHPVTNEYSSSRKQITNTLSAIKRIGLPCFVFWPNSDAGSDGVSKGIRYFRENNPNLNFFYIKNLEIEDYNFLLNKTSCLIGNSSSGIREGTYIGVPVVNIGNRQINREHGKNVIHTNYSENEILFAIKRQLKIKKYKKNYIYGNGNSAKKIIKILNKINPTTKH